MTKWPVHKQSPRTIQKHVEHQDATDNAAMISTEKTTLDLCDIWQLKMPVHGDFLRPPLSEENE